MVELFISFIFMICKNKHHPTKSLLQYFTTVVFSFIWVSAKLASMHTTGAWNKLCLCSLITHPLCLQQHPAPTPCHLQLTYAPLVSSRLLAPPSLNTSELPQRHRLPSSSSPKAFPFPAHLPALPTALTPSISPALSPQPYPSSLPTPHHPGPPG